MKSTATRDAGGWQTRHVREASRSSLSGLPHLAGTTVVEMPPDWRSDEPLLYTFVFTDDEVSAPEMRDYYRAMARAGLEHPRLITPQVLELATLFHPSFAEAVERDREGHGYPDRIHRARLVIPARPQVATTRYYLQSLLFLSGVTLSAAIVQSRYSAGTIESKLSRLWQAGAIARRLRGQDSEMDALDSLGLCDLVRALAAQRVDAGCSFLFELKQAFASALRAITRDLSAERICLTATERDGAMRDRFGFVDEFVAGLGTRVHGLMAYGSSVTSESFADYDLVVVVEDPYIALRGLAGKSPTYRGVELNLSVYDLADFWTYQLASGDNLSSNALCLAGALEVPIKSAADLMARNHSFGFVRLRQLLGMAAFAAGQSLHTESDDKRNLYDYFVKIPSNIVKGTRAAAGLPVDKATLAHWMRERTGYDVAEARAWCRAHRAGDAIATAAWATQRVLAELNNDHPAYERMAPGQVPKAPRIGAPG